MILTGKKRIPLALALDLSERLKMQRRVRREFLRAAAFGNLKDVNQELVTLLFQDSTDPFTPIEVRRFSLFNRWYFVAILDLTTTHDCKADFAWMARRLGIEPGQAAEALEKLLALGLLKVEGGRFVKTNARIEVPTKSSHQSIRAFHAQMIDKAQSNLTSADGFENREITGLTLAADPKRITEARKRVAAFKREMFELLSGDAEAATEVFQLNIQLFPLTKMGGERE